MKIELQYFEGCPHAAPAITLVREVAGNLVPEASFSERLVENDEEARRIGFQGSPSILIDGEDIEGKAENPTGLFCRRYGSGGKPPRWLVEAALLRAQSPKHYLFLCVANSARSQMAEGIARSLAPDEVDIDSAGSVPAKVREEAIAVLHEIGIDISRHRSKSVDEFTGTDVDAVITLCAEEVCPVFLGKALRLHWGLEDPARIVGDPQARLDAFRKTRDELAKRISFLFR